MRYVPHTQEDVRRMLEAVGAPSVEALFEDIPRQVYRDREIDLPALDEVTLMREMQRMADANTAFKAAFLGAGVYRHYIPQVVTSISARPEFVTAYTPYQPELSQGVLQAIFEYQTGICRLTDMDATNASMYDGASAACEGVLMARAIKRKGHVVVLEGVHPHTAETLATYMTALDIEMKMVSAKEGRISPEDVLEAAQGACCVIAQNPNFYGIIEDMDKIGEAAHDAGALLIACVNPISLALLRTPGEYGADIVCGDGQPLGLPMQFGGPGLGFLATKQAHLRRLPGRIAGKTQDSQGRDAYVLTLQAREQHIRREKAASNICSNHALCALSVSAYLSAMGPQGLCEAASACALRARELEGILAGHGLGRMHGGEYFHEFVTSTPICAHALQEKLLEKGILSGLPVYEGKGMLWCATEMTGQNELEALNAALLEVLG